MHRVTIFVRTHGGEEQRVGWWPPASPRSLRRAIAAALAIPLPLGSEARLTLRDGDGHLVPLEMSDDLPEGMRLVAELDGDDYEPTRKSLASSASRGSLGEKGGGLAGSWRRLFQSSAEDLDALAGGDDDDAQLDCAGDPMAHPQGRAVASALCGYLPPRDGPGALLWADERFQRQLIKFERVLSFLASERTYLAWLRAALTLMSEALTIWKLYHSATSAWLRPWLYWCGFMFMLCVTLTVVVGIVRWRATARIFEMADEDAFAHFGSVGVNLQAALLGMVLVVTAFGYLVVGANNELVDFRPGIMLD